MEKRCANAHILIYNIVFELISAASTFFAFYFCVRDFFSSNITFASFMQFFTQSVTCACVLGIFPLAQHKSKSKQIVCVYEL